MRLQSFWSESRWTLLPPLSCSHTIAHLPEEVNFAHDSLGQLFGIGSSVDIKRDANNTFRYFITIANRGSSTTSFEAKYIRFR
jgi:hypothetical protein